MKMPVDYKHRVDVYRNLNAASPDEGLSIKCMESGHDHYQNVIDHKQSVLLSNVDFVVQEGTWETSLREGKRNVHAFARGRYSFGTIPHGKEVHYDRQSGEFKLSENDVAVDSADAVEIEVTLNGVEMRAVGVNES